MPIQHPQVERMVKAMKHDTIPEVGDWILRYSVSTPGTGSRAMMMFSFTENAVKICLTDWHPLICSFDGFRAFDYDGQEMNKILVLMETFTDRPYTNKSFKSFDEMEDFLLTMSAREFLSNELMGMGPDNSNMVNMMMPPGFNPEKIGRGKFDEHVTRVIKRVEEIREDFANDVDFNVGPDEQIYAIMESTPTNERYTVNIYSKVINDRYVNFKVVYTDLQDGSKHMVMEHDCDKNQFQVLVSLIEMILLTPLGASWVKPLERARNIA